MASAAARAKSAACWGLTSAMGSPSGGGLRRPSSSGRLGQEARMNHGAVARECGCLDDVVVPVHRQRLGLPVDEDFEERIKIAGVKARRRRGEPRRVAEA